VGKANSKVFKENFIKIYHTLTGVLSGDLRNEGKKKFKKCIYAHPTR
jgi:hypothetical protein